MTTVNNELRTLNPEKHIQTTQGLIELAPFKFKYFPKVLDLVSKYIDTFTSSETAADIVQKLMANAGEQTLNDLTYLIFLASGKEREFLDELGWNEVSEILLTIVEQNIDFFFQIGDRLNALGRDRREESKSSGEEPAPSSSNTDTVGKQLESTASSNSTSS